VAGAVYELLKRFNANLEQDNIFVIGSDAIFAAIREDRQVTGSLYFG
jgi:hypothetical protein